MVAPIGAVAAPAQRASYYERDGYSAKDDPAHRDASAWQGRDAVTEAAGYPVQATTPLNPHQTSSSAACSAVRSR